LHEDQTNGKGRQGVAGILIASCQEGFEFVLDLATAAVAPSGQLKLAPTYIDMGDLLIR
jgi:hypothetical protein